MGSEVNRDLDADDPVQQEARRQLALDAQKRLLRVVEAADVEALHDLIVEVKDHELWTDGGSNRNVQQWIYKELGRRENWYLTKEQKVSVVRALYEERVGSPALGKVFKMGGGAISEVIQDLKFGTTVGRDGKEHQRGRPGSGGRPKLDLTGEVFGRLTALDAERIKGRWHWRCQCECGNETVVRADNLVHWRTRSCGCQQHVAHRR